MFHVIHVDSAYPRCALASKQWGPSNPVVTIDFGVRCTDGDGRVGISDLCETLFFPAELVDLPLRPAYDEAVQRYATSKQVVDQVASFAKPDVTGDQVHQIASTLFQKHYPGVVLRRNIGHWIRDYVEGQAFVRGCQRALREGDIVCLELPIAYASPPERGMDVSVSYERQGIVTPNGVVWFH